MVRPRGCTLSRAHKHSHVHAHSLCTLTHTHSFVHTHSVVNPPISCAHVHTHTLLCAHTHALRTCPQPHVLTLATHSPPSQVRLHTQPGAGLSLSTAGIWGGLFSAVGTSYRTFSSIPWLCPLDAVAPPDLRQPKVSPYTATCPQARGQNHPRSSTCGPDTATPSPSLELASM